jgi:hypothetical protein
VQGRAYPRVGRAFLTTALSALFALTTSRAVAGDLNQEEAVRVVYRAPSSCPDESVFVARFRARTQHGRFAEPGELARVFDVSVSDDGEASAGFVGHVEFIDVDGQRVLRSVPGATCDEVVSSLALITALAIDDRVAAAETVDAPKIAENQPLPSPTIVGPSEPLKKIRPSVQSRSSVRPQPVARTRRMLRWDIGVNSGLLSWVTPKPGLDFGGFVEVGSRDPAWTGRASIFDAQQTETVSGVSRATFTTTWLRLELCPVALALPRHFSLLPCAAFDAGALRAVGERSTVISSASSATIPWLSGALLARLDWEFAQRLVVGLAGELGLPLIRHEFEFEAPHTSLFQVPAAGVGLQASVGLRFP